jgi:CRISPR-associated protein Cas1
MAFLDPNYDCSNIVAQFSWAQNIDGYVGKSAQKTESLSQSPMPDVLLPIRILVGAEWGFDSRRRRPPPDPINSMLSFGYSLLTQEVISAVNTVGLDPCMGFLHHPRVGRPSLALDLIEEFRTPIVDSLVLKLVFTNSFSPKDFILLDGESPSCLLLPEARKRFLAAYERRMLTLFTHIPTGRRVTWRQSLGLQSRKLADSLMREDIQYTPIIWK